MSPLVGLILFIVFFAAMIVFSSKLKINIGILGILFAFILAGWFGGVSPSTIVGYFPLSTIASLFCASLFFCYIVQTGVFTGIVERILYFTHGRTGAIAFALFLCSAVLAAIGGAEAAPLIMSPIAFAFVTYAGMNPLAALISCYFGTGFAGICFWASGGSAFRSLAEAVIGESASYTFSFETLLFLAVFYIICMVASYFLLKSYKMDPEKVKLYTSNKPEPFSSEQKRALGVLCVVIFFIVVPVVFQTLIYPNPVTEWLSQHLALKQACILGVIAFHILGIGDSKDIFKNHIPWGSFVSIGGCCMIVQCANALGIVDLLSNALTDAVPAFLIPAVIVALSALLSFASNAFAIIPLFAPMAPALAAATGLHEATICACILSGCVATGLSPISMGGSLWQIGASEEQREAIFTKQWLAAAITMIVMILISIIGAWNVVDGIFY